MNKITKIGNPVPLYMAIVLPSKYFKEIYNINEVHYITDLKLAFMRSGCVALVKRKLAACF